MIRAKNGKFMKKQEEDNEEDNLHLVRVNIPFIIKLILIILMLIPWLFLLKKPMYSLIEKMNGFSTCAFEEKEDKFLTILEQVNCENQCFQLEDLVNSKQCKVCLINYLNK